MRKETGRRTAAALLLLLLFSLAGMALPALSEEETAGETVTGYFRENKLIRPRPEPSRDMLGTVYAYTVVTVESIGNNWATYTSPEGIGGYLHYADIVPVPEPEPCEPWIGYCANRQGLRSLPEGSQKDPRRIEAFEMLTVDGVFREYLHVSTPAGETGYILAKLVIRAEFEPEPISPVRFCAAEGTRGLEMPLKGAGEILSLSADTLYETAEEAADYYVMRTEDGRPAYVWKGSTALLQSPGPENTDFFRKPRITGSGRTAVPEEVCRTAVVRQDTVLYFGDGTQENLPSGSRLYVYASCCEFCGVGRGQHFGYVRRADLEIRDGEAAAALSEADLSGASIRRNEFLDKALPLLEEGNCFLRRYNAVTGAELEPLFSLGVPYFWGGRNFRTITGRLPEYNVREAWQSSINYYQKGTTYLYGFDCIGLVKYIYSAAGHRIDGTVEALLEASVCRAGHHIWCSDTHPLPEDWALAAEKLEIGDLIWVKHPGVHAMVYIGTLRDYGYTEEQLPALSGALDYPLAIQSGRNPYCYFRFRDMLKEQKKGRLAEAEPPDGGASVCILGVDPAEAEMYITFLEGTNACFEVEGTCITVFRFDTVVSSFFYRATPPEDGTEKAPEAGAEGSV